LVMLITDLTGGVIKSEVNMKHIIVERTSVRNSC